MGNRYDTCAVCEVEGLKVNEYEYSESLGGTVCLECMRNEHPDHLFIGDKSIKKDDIATLVDPTGLVTMVHVPTGIAARKENAKEAKKLLDKILDDVRTVERNERYGNCME